MSYHACLVWNNHFEQYNTLLYKDQLNCCYLFPCLFRKLSVGVKKYLHGRRYATWRSEACNESCRMGCFQHRLKSQLRWFIRLNTFKIVNIWLTFRNLNKTLMRISYLQTYIILGTQLEYSIFKLIKVPSIIFIKTLRLWKKFPFSWVTDKQCSISSAKVQS